MDRTLVEFYEHVKQLNEIQTAPGVSGGAPPAPAAPVDPKVAQQQQQMTQYTQQVLGMIDQLAGISAEMKKLNPQLMQQAVAGATPTQAT